MTETSEGLARELRDLEGAWGRRELDATQMLIAVTLLLTRTLIRILEKNEGKP